MTAQHVKAINGGSEIAPPGITCELTLFVSGASDRSMIAITNARQLCDTYLQGRYRLNIVDVHEDAGAALSSGVYATPTLVRTYPLPQRKVVGDLSRAGKVLAALQLPGTSIVSEASG